MATPIWRGCASAATTAGGLALLVLTANCHGAATVTQTSNPPRPRDLMPQCMDPKDNGNTFANNVYMLTSFDFNNNGGTNLQTPKYTPPNYIDPNTGHPKQVGNPYHSDMAAAFAIAPQPLQTALCSLALNQRPGLPTGVFTGVFVDPNDQAPFAWSFWEVKSKGQDDGKGRYVAVGAKLWQRSTSFTLSQLETLILQHLLGNNAQGTIFGSVALSPASPEKPGMSMNGLNGPSNLALMAILAREVGEIVYHDYVDPTSEVVSASTSRGDICVGNTKTFQDFSWIGSARTVGHIQTLGEESNPTNITPKYQAYEPSQARPVTNQFPAPKPAVLSPVATKLANVYDSPNSSDPSDVIWADLLAETTPYDDFAETFRLMMLSSPLTPANALAPSMTPVSSMTVDFLNVPKVGMNKTPNVISHLVSTYSGGDSILKQKVECINTELQTWIKDPNYP